MSPLKRHPALQDLSREHQRFLVQARSIRWCVEGSPHAQSIADVVQSFLAFWEREGEPHLRVEEEILVPLCFSIELEAERLLDDHDWLRDHVTRLAGFGQNDITLLQQIGDRMHDHVRFEEQVIFTKIQKRLSEDELLALGEQLATFHLS